MLTWSGGLASLFCLVLLAGACTGGSSAAADAPSQEDSMGIESVDVIDGELGDLLDLGEIDGVIRMRQPAGRPVPPGFGLAGTVVSTRPILSVATPEGPVDMHEMRVNDSDMGPGLQRCLVIIGDNSSGASCSPASDPPVTDIGLAGAQGGDGQTLYALVGPVDMTHFVITLAGQRLAVVPREGHALVAVAERGFCTSPPGLVGAWRGDEELVVTVATAC